LENSPIKNVNVAEIELKVITKENICEDRIMTFLPTTGIDLKLTPQLAK